MPLQRSLQIPGLPTPAVPQNLPQGLPPGVALPQIPQTPVIPPQPSGLDNFINNFTDPTGSSQFLLDLGARLLQPRAKGSSPLGAITNAASEAVQGLTARKGAAAKAGSDAQLQQSQLLTAEAQRGKLAVDTQQGEQELGREGLVRENLRADAELKRANARHKRVLIKKGGGGKIASKVQEAQGLGAIFWKNHGPDSTDPKYKTADEAVEAAYRFFQPIGKDPDAWYADAVVAYQQNRVLMEPEEFEAGITAIGVVRDDWKREQGILVGGADDVANAFDQGVVPPEVESQVSRLRSGQNITPEETTALLAYYKQQAGGDPELAKKLFLAALGQEAPAPVIKGSRKSVSASGTDVPDAPIPQPVGR